MQNRDLSRVLSTTSRHLKKLDSLGVKTVKDFLLYFPRTYNDTSEFTKISELTTDQAHTIKGKLTNLFNMRTKHGKKITRGIFTDETGSIEVVWFNQPHLTRMLPRKAEIILTGKAKYSMGKMSLQSPTHEIIKPYEEQIHTGRIVPVYHETEGITSKWMREKLKPLIDNWLELFPEYMPEEVIQEHDFLPYNEAIRNAHFPENESQLAEARDRLAFDELFLLQLKVLQKKWHWQNIKDGEAKKIAINKEVLKAGVESLPYELTEAQKRTLMEILEDLQKPFPMSRLVQGDVGSGKTVVAALAALNTVMEGHQVAIMAPTEILAKQHYQTFISTLKDFSLNIQFIAGSSTKKQKEEVIRQMKTGTVDIMIGTHSLIQEGIGFKSLGLAIIDEQHRFGVKQREILKSYGSPHLLNMTATPIPRTLAITIYGDQDLSVIDELPKGRQEITTKLVPENKRQDAYRWIEDQVKKGRQTFIICPLIDESDTLEVKSVLQEFAFLADHIFPDLELGLLHGKLKQEDKDKVMEDFKDNKIQILVSTSVIEVGIDVPNATIMLIEGSERFGLSQLHQFRGRVGRGEHKSYCFLFTNSTSEEGTQRMKAMEKHNSGFKLSEIDLELRGPGEVYGVRQSGIPDLKMASLTDTEMVEKARKSAKKIIEKDPLLKTHDKLAAKIAELEEIYVND
ncbi:ATP-dependent DNA helicase RecG [Candidatus Peregrinibacteria bacterium]|jgi:ATP-dependent DNA helicase RecG|nr:ATP-dependent DNA helicase RecG [Candidatus Peregrinibacteria bacterium]